MAKDINQLSDLRGKTVVTQINGPHLSLIGNMLKDAGLSTHDVTIKFVNDITAAPDWKDTSVATDPANAFRRDPQVSGATCISPDIQALVGSLKDGVGTGQEGTMKGARAIFTTRIANNIIFDVYAVRRDFLERNPGVVKGFREKHLAEQEYFLSEVENIEKKSGANKDRVARFRTLCKPLAKIFNQDENAVDDYVIWVGSGLHLAGRVGNTDFFNDTSPVNFGSTTSRIQDFFKELGLISSPVALATVPPDDPEMRIKVSSTGHQEPSPINPVNVTSTDGKRVLFAFSFSFPANSADLKWRDYASVFARIYETTSRYGGAAIELRGHADPFVYDFLMKKYNEGAKTYEVKSVVHPMPSLEEIKGILTTNNKLSQDRADAVKAAYQQYLQTDYPSRPADATASRFDAKGMGITQPIVKEPKTPADTARNMRVEMVVLAVESELQPGISPEDMH